MKALVTGGGGFLGRRIVELLRAEGWAVRSFARSPSPALEALGVEVVRGDVADAPALAAAARGCEVVIHAAARAGVWGARADYLRVNVGGTANTLAAARAAGARALVHTSSPSVVFDGRGHRRAADAPLATRYLCAYQESKALAERLVLEANGRDGLATCALRPHLIFGPGDPHLVPRLLERARRGRLWIVGEGQNEVGLTHVDNAAWAHLDAARALVPDAPHAGRAYFVAQEEPVVLWSWIAELLARLGLPGPRGRLPLALALALGASCEALWRAARRRSEPPLTRFVALQLATDHSYDLAPARADLGYRERVGLREGTERLVRSLRSGAPVVAPRGAEL